MESNTTWQLDDGSDAQSMCGTLKLAKAVLLSTAKVMRAHPSSCFYIIHVKFDKPSSENSE